MKYLIVGLGNIGAEYADTRHNIGFTVLDAFAGASNAVFSTDRYGAVAQVRHKGRTFVLLKPSTYMNLSGKAVSYWLQREKIMPENLLVITDDIALPLGTLRLRARGSDGGHNGLRSIDASLGSQNYARLRFGIGGDFPRGMQVEYVLARWDSAERKALVEPVEMAGDVIRSFGTVGIERAMNAFNKRKPVVSTEGKPRPAASGVKSDTTKPRAVESESVKPESVKPESGTAATAEQAEKQKDKNSVWSRLTGLGREKK